MSRILIAIFLVVAMAFLCLAWSCAPNYSEIVKEQTEAGNVTPITPAEASAVQSSEPVVTFVITDSGISVDKVVNIGGFHKGAEADVVYLVINESALPVTPSIFYTKGTRVDDYSQVEGQGYVDAPECVEQWITILPMPFEMPPNSAQGYLVTFIMPEDAKDIPKKFAFQVGVAVGSRMQIGVSPWWLVSMR